LVLHGSKGDVTVTVPPGALSADVSIMVSETMLSAPSGSTAYSSVFHFEPDGLTFAAPVTVSMPYQGDAASAALLWSEQPSSGYVELDSFASATVVTAQVMTFSYGYVGKKHGGIDGGATGDGGTPDAGAMADGGSSPPGAPMLVVADAGVRSAVVAWAAPADPGSGALTGYVVDAWSAGALSAQASVFAPATTAIISGLANGTTYTFTVTARNAFGAGPPSAASVAVTTPDLPATPAISAPSLATAGVDGWSASVQADPSASYAWAVYGGTLTNPGGDVGVLDGGVDSITFRPSAVGTVIIELLARNAVGDSEPAFAVVNALAAPSVPVISAPPELAAGKPASATVTGDVGLGYACTASGATLTAGAMGTLDRGVAMLAFDVTAAAHGNVMLSCTSTNAAGTTSAAGTATIKAVGLPSAPASVTPQGGVNHASVQWTPPSDNGGGTITGYVVSVYASGMLQTGLSVAATDSSADFPLSPGPYTFSVSAMNVAGTGPAATTAATTVNGPPSPSTSTIVASPTIVPADGTTQVTLTVTIRDVYGQTVPSAPVQLAATGGLNTFTPSSGAGTTDASGVFIAKLKSGAAGTKSVSVTVNTQPMAFANVTFTFTACLPRYGEPPEPLVGTSPWTVTGADFNGDGHLDLAVADRAGGSVFVLIGRGDATFQPAVGYAVGSTPQGITTDDLNGDGHPDLVVANTNSNSINILLANSDGTLQPALVFSTGPSPVAVATADFDGDGKRDVAVIDNSELCVRLGKGDGTLQASQCVSAVQPLSVVSADFNRDGRADLAFTDKNGARILLGNGNGTFAAAPTIPVAFNASSLAADDFNGDGRVDLAVAENDRVGVFLGNGDGTFGAAADNLTGPQPSAVVASDLDGDGRTDLVVTTGSTGAGVLKGNGDGTFQTMAPYVVGDITHSVFVGDLNSDGHPDLVFGNILDNAISLLLGHGDGTFGLAASPAGPAPASVDVADFNRDGVQDLAVANRNTNTVSIVLGLADGGFQPPSSSAVGGAPAFIIAGDLNGDGKPDIAVANSGTNDVSVLLGAGDGTLQTAVTYPAGNSPSSVAFGDLNGDGRPDLVIGDGPPLQGSGSAVSVLLALAAGGFQAATNYAITDAPGNGEASVVVRDVNGDGHADIAVASGVDITVLMGVGDGTFRPPVTTRFGFNPAGMVAADFSSDGLLDLVIADSNGAVLVALGAGDGTFPASAGFAACPGASSIASADFNGDGRADLALSCRQSNDIAVLLGHGDGSFEPPISFVAGGQPSGIVTADFNGDGHPDLAVANSGSNTVSVLRFTACLP
jgi:hypothetical protein